MRLERLAAVLGLLALLAVPVFATGQGEDAEEDGPVTVTLGYNAFLSDSFTDAPPPIDVIRDELARQYPNITLEYQTMAQDLLDTLIIWMTSQDSNVDVYGMDEPWVNQFGRAGWAVPLNDRIPDLEERFSSSGLDTYSYEGERLGVPFWGSVTGLYYRTDILEEYGFDPPETVDELVEIVETVQEDDPENPGFLWPGARNEDLVMYYSTLLHAFGGSYTEADGSYAFDSDDSLEAVEFMRRTIDDGISPREVQNWERLEARQRFANGEGIFLWDNHDIVIWLDDPERSEIAGNWGFMPFPAQSDGERVAITGGFAFSANPYSDNVDAAVKVLDVIASEAVQKGFALAWGPVQYYDGLYEDPEVQEYNPNVDRLIPVLDAAKNRPPSQSYAELSGLLQEELNAAVTGTASPTDTIEQISDRAEALRD
jgi:multiple sugar transport system substrate-binding protein